MPELKDFHFDLSASFIPFSGGRRQVNSGLVIRVMTGLFRWAASRYYRLSQPCIKGNRANIKLIGLTENDLRHEKGERWRPPL